ncbi:hypothetical protein J2D73_00180 [Acetobacter sacchari]|uniref:Major facilitator superfamily (MFS) profile domain-containing protein n=1 Tax=Acetobacter sacchari TaxID=2661687 RepID=A0ABS3LQM9_9PROT|nr:MFS transporter [Acetobacter sacchari]MBO1358214.1 hypothetical protein [Acetobacter sacchari]
MSSQFKSGATTSDAVQPSPPVSKVVCLAAGSIGNFLEFYNFMAYAFFAPMIGQAFFPVKGALMQLLAALITFAAGFLARPLGSLVMGFYTQRMGVGSTLMATFLMMAAGSALLVVTPDYATIGVWAPVLVLISRLLHGFSEGGEVGPATEFIYSLRGERDAGAMASAQALTQFMSQLAAVAIGLVLSATLSHEQLYAWGWRVPFVLGLAIVPFGLFFRRLALGGLDQAAAQPVVTESSREPFPWLVIALTFCVILTGTVTTYLRAFGASYAISVLHLSPTLGMAAMSIGLIAGLAAIVTGIHLQRSCRPRPLILGVSGVYLIVILPVYHFSVHSPGLASLIVLNVVTNVMPGLLSAVSSELVLRSIPAAQRSFVFGVVYSITVSVFGGATQPFVTWLILMTGNAMVPGYLASIVIPVAPIALLALSRRAAKRSAQEVNGEAGLRSFEVPVSAFSEA